MNGGCLNPVFAQPGTTPEQIWTETPTQIKGAVIQAMGWGLCYATTILYLAIRGVGHQGLCRGLAISVLTWQPFWYGAAIWVGDIPASKIFFNFTIFEIISCCVFGYLGSVVPTNALSKKLRGSTTTANVRLGLLCFLPAMLAFSQLFTVFFKPENYAMEIAMQDPEGQDATKVWESTPNQAKEAAMEQAGWVFALASVMFCMLIFEPGADRDLCICWVIIFINWTFVWYGSCMAYADVDGDYEVPWQRFFIYETLGSGELLFMVIFGFLGFTTWGKEEAPQAASEGLLE